MDIFNQFSLEPGTEIKLSLNPKFKKGRESVLEKRFDLPLKVRKNLSAHKWVVNSVTTFGPSYGKIFIYNLASTKDRLIRLRLLSGEDVLLPGNANTSTPLVMKITKVQSKNYFV